MTTDVIVVDDSETIIINNDPISVIVTSDDTLPEVVIVSEVDTLVVDNEKLNVILTTEDTVNVITEGSQGPMGPQGPQGLQGLSTNISSAPDVNITNIQDGSLLIYSSQEQKWVANTQLTNQSLESGHY
jgi:hypothetical protein